MKSNIIISMAAATIVAGIPVLSGQESVPVGTVRDGLRESAPAVTEQEPAGPKFTDIDRLFEESRSDDSSVEQEENGVSEMKDSFASPIGNEMALDASDLISVDYPNEEIRTVLRNVADLYTLNLVVPDTLVGTTSIKLRDVTWRQIYSVVLEPVGYTFIEEGSIIKIVSRDKLNIEPPITEIFMVNYADADSIAVTLRNLVDSSKGGAVQVDKRSNALIVSERASKMDSIRSVVERLDKPTQQVFIETRFVEVTDTKDTDIGIDWTSLKGHQVDVSDYGAESAEGSVVVLDKLNSLTAGWSKNPIYKKAVFSSGQFSWLLNALEASSSVRLVSNPTVVTLNNEQAMISIGRQFPIPSYQYNEETGGFEVSGFDYKDIGIILRVTPSVNHNGLITLKVEPEVSSSDENVQFGGASGAQIPIVQTRRTTTQIALQDGYTMGIGGLMESTSSDASTQVPLLGKIPGVGRLFRDKSKVGYKRNLLIFITARILPGEEADFEDVFSQEMMDASGVDAVSLRNR